MVWLEKRWRRVCEITVTVVVRSNQVTLVIATTVMVLAPGASGRRCAQYRLPRTAVGCWHASFPASPVNVPDDLLGRHPDSDEELHPISRHSGSLEWLHNGDGARFGWTVSTSTRPLLLQEFGGIPLQLRDQEIRGRSAHRALYRAYCARVDALVEAVADQACPMPIVRGGKKPFRGPCHPGAIGSREEREGWAVRRVPRRREIRQKPQGEGLVDRARQGPASIAGDGYSEYFPGMADQGSTGGTVEAVEDQDTIEATGEQVLSVRSERVSAMAVARGAAALDGAHEFAVTVHVEAVSVVIGSALFGRELHCPPALARRAAPGERLLGRRTMALR